MKLSTRRIATLTAIAALTTAVAVSAAGPAAAAPAAAPPASTGVPGNGGPYQQTTPPDDLKPLNIGDRVAMCADGYHVDGTYRKGFVGNFAPTYWLNAASNVNVTWLQSLNPEGYDSQGNPYYQGIDVGLANTDWLSSHEASITWQCDPN